MGARQHLATTAIGVADLQRSAERCGSWIRRARRTRATHQAGGAQPLWSIEREWHVRHAALRMTTLQRSGRVTLLTRKTASGSLNGTHCRVRSVRGLFHVRENVPVQNMLGRGSVQLSLHAMADIRPHQTKTPAFAGVFIDAEEQEASGLTSSTCPAPPDRFPSRAGTRWPVRRRSCRPCPSTTASARPAAWRGRS